LRLPRRPPSSAILGRQHLNLRRYERPDTDDYSSCASAATCVSTPERLLPKRLWTAERSTKSSQRAISSDDDLFLSFASITAQPAVRSACCEEAATVTRCAFALFRVALPTDSILQSASSFACWWHAGEWRSSSIDTPWINGAAAASAGPRSSRFSEWES
jgi:hypothetical protein